MLKNYKCNSCGVSFPAEEGPRVVCPHCQSDDTVKEKEANSMKKVIIIAVGAFVLAVGAGMLIGFLSKDNGPETYKKSVAVTEERAMEKDNTYSRQDQPDSELDEVVEVDEVEPDFVEPDFTEVEEVLVELPDEPATAPKEKTPKTQKDDIIAKELANAKKTPAELPKTDAKAKQPAKEPAKAPAPAPALQPRLTNAQVQALVNKVLSSGNANALLGAKGISKQVRFSYVNTGGETIPGGVSGLKSGVEMLGFSGYTVVSLDFDAQNNVTVITLQPIK